MERQTSYEHRLSIPGRKAFAPQGVPNPTRHDTLKLKAVEARNGFPERVSYQHDEDGSGMPEAEVKARVTAARERAAASKGWHRVRDPVQRTGPIVLALMNAGMTPEGALDTALDGLGPAMLHALGATTEGGPR